MTTASATPTAASPPRTEAAAGTAPSSRWRNPWRHAWFLEGFTWLYLLWSLAPIAIAVLFSFNKGKSQATFQGLSMRWYTGDPLQSVLHNPTLHQRRHPDPAAVVLHHRDRVPLGVAFALGINRWYSRTSATYNYVMIMSFVVPELIFGVAMFFVFTTLFSSIVLARHLGRGTRPGQLEHQLAGDHRAGTAGHHRQGSTRKPRPTWAAPSCRPCGGC